VATGWREICTRFHRQAPESARKCLESDTILADRLRQGEKYSVYQCKNGLIDVAVPIIVEGTQVGRLYSGQFLFAPPDMDFFRRQARECGFDENAYLDAVRKVPIVSEEKVRLVMGFMCRMAEIVVRMGMTNKRIDDADLIVRKSPAVLFRWRPGAGWPIEFVSDNVIQFGYTPEELISKRFSYFSMVHPEDRDRIMCEAEEYYARGEERVQKEYRIVTKGGETRWVNEHTIGERNGEGGLENFRGIVIDITERKKIESLVMNSLEEKEMLLKEVHHRVKNNLQIISTLLDLQSESIHDRAALDAFRESQDRIKAMALIHESLYKTSDMVSIDLGRYIEDLSVHLLNSYLIEPERITLQVDAGGVSLGIDKAIPCGLIINELISNALKHAFPGDLPGEIKVVFQRAKEVSIALRVEDTGVGLPAGLEITKTGTLGLQLVTMLARQLHGVLTVDSGHGGTSFSMIFPGK
jgi:PAS domain S-box-containing protein